MVVMMIRVVKTTRPRRWMMSSVDLHHDTFIDIIFLLDLVFIKFIRWNIHIGKSVFDAAIHCTCRDLLSITSKSATPFPVTFFQKFY